MPVFFRQLHGNAEGASTGDDGNFMHGIGSWQKPRCKSVAAFVVGRDSFFVIRQNQAAAFPAHEDLVLGEFKITHIKAILI